MYRTLTDLGVVYHTHVPHVMYHVTTHTHVPMLIRAQRRGSGRCSVCTKAKRGSCGTDNAVRGCLFRPGGPIPSLPRSNSSKSALAAAAAQGHLPPRPTASRASTKAPLSRAALGSGSLKAPPAKRTRVRRRFMSASTAAAAAALHQWHGRDPAELQAILDAPAPVAPPLVAAGPPPAPPEPDQATLEEERRVLRTYRQVVARRAAFPKVRREMVDWRWGWVARCAACRGTTYTIEHVAPTDAWWGTGWCVCKRKKKKRKRCVCAQLEAEMHAKLEAQAQAQRRLDAIIAQQAARAAARVPHADAVHAPLDNEATVEQPAVGTMRADVAALGAFLFGQLAGAPGAMRSPC